MKQFLAILLLALLVSACSSTGDPENELLQAASTTEAEGSQSDAQEAEPTALPVVVPTLPAGVPDLPSPLWPTMDDPSPTAEDALKDYLLYHPSETFGYQLAVGCQGLAAEANPNTLCTREPRVSEEGDLQLYDYSLGPPPPGLALYSIGIRGSVSQGWWITWANTIAR